MIADIEIDESEEFLDISSFGKGRYKVPTVTFYSYDYTRCLVNFNSLAKKLLLGVDNITVKMGKDHILFIPATPGWNSRCLNRRNRCAQISFAALAPYVKFGVPYRGYPYKGGIAIKRNEPLSERKEEKNELQENEGTA